MAANSSKERTPSPFRSNRSIINRLSHSRIVLPQSLKGRPVEQRRQTPSDDGGASSEAGEERMNPEGRVRVAGFFIFVVVFFFGLCYLQYSRVPAAANQIVELVEERKVPEAVKERKDGECNLFVGKWVRDESFPLYQARDCPFIDAGFRCEANGRPDNLYTKWRWQPAHCDDHRFDARGILERLRGRRVAFVGDSIGRNQWESLLCLLSSAVADKKSVYEVNGSPITKHNGFLSFMFRPYNCTIEYYREPFLVSHGRPPPRSPKNIRSTLKLDVISWSSTRWHNADLIVLNAGHWWNYEKTIQKGSYFQVKNRVMKQMTVEEAYRKSIETLVEWVHRGVDPRKTLVVLRSFAPVHFRHGSWKTGGTCHNETLPDSEDRPVAEHWSLRVVQEVISERARRRWRRPAVEVLNITEMTARRPDGHASLYYLGPGKVAPRHRQDCSHWCLPGVPDAWNELLFTLFLRWDSAPSSAQRLKPPG